MSIKEAAAIFCKSPRTMRRRAKRDELKYRYKPGLGRAGKVMEIWVPDNMLNSTKDTKTKDKLRTTKDTPTKDTKTKDKLRTTRDTKTKDTSAKEIFKKNDNILDSHSEGFAQGQPYKAGGPLLPPAIPNLEPELPEEYRDVAQLRATLCNKVLEAYEKFELKSSARESILDAYNSRLLLPNLYNKDGHIGDRTLRRYLKRYIDSEKDYKALAPAYSSAKRGTKVTEAEANFLMNKLLNDNKISIGTAIRKLKQQAHLGTIESRCSNSTLRRWVERYREKHPDVWTLTRHGEKAFQEKINATVLRDQSALAVGDVWVADGHVLNFDILTNPGSNKPVTKRMMMIMFFDWASRYPVGASIATTENSDHISVALRNGILHAGYTPKFVYLDNGRAFRSKLFHGSSDKHDLEEELGGVYSRLGIGVKFAKPYNAKAKVIERFFLTFQENFERFLNSFRGSSIGDKPAYLQRNEKWVQSIRNSEPLTLPEATKLIEIYISYYYGLTEHRTLKAKPKEVFYCAKVDPERYVHPAELNFLMLRHQVKKLSNNGIYFSNVGLWFYDAALMKHVGQSVIVKYDYFDMRSVLVYDARGQYICQAQARHLQHPMVDISDNPELNGQKLSDELKMINRNKKKAKKLANEELKRLEDASSVNLADLKYNPRLFNNSRMLKHPVKQQSIEHEQTKNKEVESIKVKKEKKQADNGDQIDELCANIGI